MVEVAHEALLREWPRLHEWLEEDAQGRELRHHLAQAARQWDERGRDSADLYRGARLSATLDWATTHGRELNQLERDFLAAGRRAGERAVRRLRTGVAVLAVLLLAAVGAGIFAFHQSAVSRHEARVASGRALTEASAASLDLDPERGILLALKAIDTFRSTSGSVPREAVETLHRAIEASRVRLAIHTPASHYAAFSPNGRWIATAGAASPGGEGGEAFLWDARTGRKILAFPRQNGSVTGLKFSPDGSRLYTHIAGRGIVAWSTRTGDQLLRLPIPGPIAEIALSPDGERIADTRLDGNLEIWDLRARRRILTITPPGSLCGLSFSPNGRDIAASPCFGLPPAAALVWDSRTGRQRVAVGGPSAAQSANFEVAYSPDGRRIVTAGEDGKARVWDARSGRLLTTLIGHTGWVFAARFSPDGRRIATGSTDGTARVWDSDSGRQLLVLPGHTKAVYTVAFSPDGRRLLTGSEDGTDRVWDVQPQGGRDALTVLAQTGYWGALALDYSPDGQQLVTGGGGGRPASVWDATTGRRLLSLAHDGDVNAAVFNPDGTQIVLAGSGIPAIVDARSGRTLLTVRRPGGDFQTGAAWTPDGRHVALSIGNNPGEVVLLDARTGKLVRSFPFPPNGASAVAISPDGSRLAAARFGPTAKIWDLRSGRLLATLRGHGDLVFSITFSPDGSRVATASRDGTTKVWDGRTGRLVRTIRGTGSGSLWGAVFSPDGKLLATAGDDTTARLWDASTGKELLTLTGATRAVQAVAFSPDGTRLAAASADGNVRVYVLPLDELMAVARSRLTRSWTPIECKEFLNANRCPAPP
jgi:WD40 repeat protein